MKSIKEKSKEWCSNHSNKGCTEQCDGCWQLKQAWGCEQHNMETSYVAGANYVLDEIEKMMPSSDDVLENHTKCKSAIFRLQTIIEQLKK